MSEATAGPWMAQAAPHQEFGRDDVPRWRIGAAGGRIPIIDGYVIHQEDARLIAAAPDMMAALVAVKEIALHGKLGEIREGITRTVHGALAKARGEA